AEHQCWWTESRFKNEIRHSQAGILDFSRSRRFGFWFLVFRYSFLVVFDLIIAEISSSKFQSCHFPEIFRSWKLRIHSWRNLQGSPARCACSQTLKVVIVPNTPSSGNPHLATRIT